MNLFVTRRASVFAVLLPLATLTISCGGNGATGPILGIAPSNLTYTSPLTAVVGAAIAPLSPSVNGTVTSYSVNPELPSGLSLNTTTGVVSGTPTAGATQAAYTITASNSSGSTTFSLSVAVNSASGVAMFLSTFNLNFGNQLVSTQLAVQTVAILNIGTENLDVNSVDLTGADLSSFA